MLNQVVIYAAHGGPRLPRKRARRVGDHCGIFVWTDNRSYTSLSSSREELEELMSNMGLRVSSNYCQNSFIVKKLPKHH